jgi:hypothetical protein
MIMRSFITCIINIKSRKRKWAGHVARMRIKKNAYRILAEARRKETPRKTNT